MPRPRLSVGDDGGSTPDRCCRTVGRRWRCPLPALPNVSFCRSHLPSRRRRTSGGELQNPNLNPEMTKDPHPDPSPNPNPNPNPNSEKQNGTQDPPPRKRRRRRKTDNDDDLRAQETVKDPDPNPNPNPNPNPSPSRSPNLQQQNGTQDPKRRERDSGDDLRAEELDRSSDEPAAAAQMREETVSDSEELNETLGLIVTKSKKLVPMLILFLRIC